MNPYVGACGGGGFPMQFVGQALPPPPPAYYGGPCGPAVFPAGYVAQQALAGVAANNAPQQPIGLTCGPLLPATSAIVDGEFIVTPSASGTCDACCTAQGCFCVTDIVIGDCGPCVWLVSSIKSGLCELIQCGDILGDTFYCNCDHPPLKSSMLMPGIEFCITVENILIADSTDADEVAAATRTFYATVWGLPGDNACAPCIGPDPYAPPIQFPQPVYTPPAGYYPPYLYPRSPFNPLPGAPTGPA